MLRRKNTAANNETVPRDQSGLPQSHGTIRYESYSQRTSIWITLVKYAACILLLLVVVWKVANKKATLVAKSLVPKELDTSTIRAVRKDRFDSLSMAYEQSFGLFDDISDLMWSRMRHKAQTTSWYYDPINPH
mmetsp:Transcript_2214/g.2843  ORF Transcript_2214/g.2843 Transcript_2214/m.2843 type:complete len:133 (+) Transcript_2214:124-522(+)